ncbi:MAG: hypothetical protein KAT28_01320 [Candidatus Aenigmarchaeota archaeon]|nr:hypothetical protein [Candidatus Aenigmarchaeota archaeon]
MAKPELYGSPEYRDAIERLEKKYGFNDLFTNMFPIELPDYYERIEAVFEQAPDVVKKAYLVNVKSELEKIVDDIRKYNIKSNALLDVSTHIVFPSYQGNDFKESLGKIVNPKSRFVLNDNSADSLKEREFREVDEQMMDELGRLHKLMSYKPNLLTIQAKIDTKIEGRTDKGSAFIKYNITCRGFLDDCKFTVNKIGSSSSYGADRGLYEIVPEINGVLYYGQGELEFGDAVKIFDDALKGDIKEVEKVCTRI